MKWLEKLYNEKIVTWAYILLPIIEILTSYMIANMGVSVTPGMIYKTLFILYGVVYLILLDKKYRKINLIMLSIFAVTLILHTVITIEAFTISALFVKASQLLKYICFPIILWFLYRYVQNGKKLNIKTIVICSIIYGGTMLLAWITGTYMPTYDSRPEGGHSGWIYSGNELSSILAMFYPVIIYYTAKHRDKLGILALLFVTYGLLVIGTKTAFLAILISLFAFIVFGLLKCKKEIGKNILFITVILVMVIMAVVTYFPTLTDIAKRVNIAQSKVSTNVSEKQQQAEAVDNLVFNGRSQFLAMQKEKFDQAGIMQKLFGLHGEDKPTNQNDEYTIIERDFHDLVITYGIIPSIIYLAPMVIILFNFALRFFKDFKKEFNMYNFALCISIAMMLGVAYIVGHVLLVPTVAIFLSFVLVSLSYKDELAES